MNDRIVALLRQRKEQWLRFHRLRDVRPTEASIARRTALRMERQLADEGFTTLPHIRATAV
ncbi:MAG: hypothetical protein HC881_05555 [Leptolyngbyaceae cyanobacterium SL_7_1]|nr:hypothetical protein [Leptolyngbyaceae cyanobacterium SL_7_1]